MACVRTTLIVMTSSASEHSVTDPSWRWTRIAFWADYLREFEEIMLRTVLICDDAVFMRTMLSDILTQAGFAVIGQAQTGGEAVAKFKELQPDLVTMDIVMPDMGGIDAVRAIVAE